MEKENSGMKIDIHPNVIQELHTLFDFASPKDLRIGIIEIFFSYLCNTEVEEYKPELKEIATDFYFLIKFLEVAEMYQSEKNNNETSQL